MSSLSLYLSSMFKYSFVFLAGSIEIPDREPSRETNDMQYPCILRDFLAEEH